MDLGEGLTGKKHLFQKEEIFSILETKDGFGSFLSD